MPHSSTIIFTVIWLKGFCSKSSRKVALIAFFIKSDMKHLTWTMVLAISVSREAFFLSCIITRFQKNGKNGTREKAAREWRKWWLLRLHGLHEGETYDIIDSKLETSFWDNMGRGFEGSTEGEMEDEDENLVARKNKENQLEA